MVIDGFRLPAGVDKDRTIGHGSDLTMRRHQSHGGGLDAGAERKRAQTDGRGLIALPVDNRREQHQPVSPSWRSSQCRRS